MINGNRPLSSRGYPAPAAGYGPLKAYPQRDNIQKSEYPTLAPYAATNGYAGGMIGKPPSTPQKVGNNMATSRAGIVNNVSNMSGIPMMNGTSGTAGNRMMANGTAQNGTVSYKTAYSGVTGGTATALPAGTSIVNGASTYANGYSSAVNGTAGYQLNGGAAAYSSSNSNNNIVTNGISAAVVPPSSVPSAPSSSGSDHKRPERRGTDSKTGREVDPALIQRVLGEILDRNLGVKWEDIIGLDFAKQTLQETVILPHCRPELFKGIRAPPKGLLLFGPPGNGKTMLAKAIATEFDATFFCISAASLVSKMLGESERLMRALFQAAREHQPAIIFIDEIDSILSVRNAQENDGIQRLKTEFFVQMDGVASDQDDRILVMGATNRPAAIDPAARRRLVKRIYVPLPDKKAREALILKSFDQVPFDLAQEDLSRIATRTAGYSGFDIASLCREAALGPIRELGSKIREIATEEVRSVGFKDFKQAVRVIRPSVSPESLSYYEAWDKEFGSATTPYTVELDNDDDFDAGEDMN